MSEVNRICRNEQLRRPKILAVTVLTSLTRDDLRRVGVQAGVESQVVRLAKLAREASMDGVVASPLEIGRIRKECGRGFLIVTPGVRMARSSWDDQKRVLTPEQAIQAGADYIVVGKPIRDARDPQAAAIRVRLERATRVVAASESGDLRVDARAARRCRVGGLEDHERAALTEHGSVTRAVEGTASACAELVVRRQVAVERVELRHAPP